MSKLIVNVGAEHAEFLTSPQYHPFPIFRNLGDGRVEIVDLDAALALKEDEDGVTRKFDDSYMVWIGGNEYAVQDS